MPNHVTNVLQIRAEGERLDEILDDIKDELMGCGTIDFNKIIPMPESLDIESGSRTDEAINLYLTALNPEAGFTLEGIEKMDADAFERVSEVLNRKNVYACYSDERAKEVVGEFLKDEDLGDAISVAKTAITNAQEYGAKDWYDWRLQNWGTKWNAYDLNPSEEKGKVEFKTAWSAPTLVIAQLAKMYPDASFVHEWADEDIGYNVGRREYENGEESACIIPDEGNDALRMAFNIMGLDPEDYGYQENAKTGELENMEPEEWRLVPEEPADAGPNPSM